MNLRRGGETARVGGGGGGGGGGGAGAGGAGEAPAREAVVGELDAARVGDVVRAREDVGGLQVEVRHPVPEVQMRQGGGDLHGAHAHRLLREFDVIQHVEELAALHQLGDQREEGAIRSLDHFYQLQDARVVREGHLRPQLDLGQRHFPAVGSGQRAIGSGLHWWPVHRLAGEHHAARLVVFDLTHDAKRALA